MIWNEQNKMTCLFHDLIFLLFVPGWLGAMSMSVSLFVSPIIIGFCRRKSTRLTAVMGGLVTALGCLFTSFASQFHQLFLSYGAMIGKLALITYNDLSIRNDGFAISLSQLGRLLCYQVICNGNFKHIMFVYIKCLYSLNCFEHTT